MQKEGLIEVEKFCPSCDRHFSANEHVTACPDDGADLMPVTDDAIVQMVVAGKYRIGELIGTGGWSKVYRAFHTQLDRIVAFKLLRADLVASAERIKRFDSEAKLASNLSHPNICTVYDCGILDTGQPYLILEYIQGRSLMRVLQDEGSIEPARTVHLLKQIAIALEAAHERGIVHRDLKPGNVMIVENAGEETVKIIDFGLAKAFAAEDREQLTNTGATIGTPCYMSPEQVRGEQLDARSDMYSFGCMAYEMLTGRKPVEGNSVFETMQGHLDKEPRPMRHPERDIPQPLQDLTMRCMQKHRDDRYQTMADVERALDSYQKFGRLGDDANWLGWRRRNPLGAIYAKLRRKSRGTAYGAAKTWKPSGLALLAAAAILPLLVMAFAPSLFNQSPAKSPEMIEFLNLQKSASPAVAEAAGKKLFDELKSQHKESLPEFKELCDEMERNLRGQGRQYEAIPYIEAGFSAQKAAAAPGSDQYIKAYEDVSNRLISIDHRNAAPYVDELWKLTAKRYGTNSKEYCKALYHKGWCNFAIDHPKEAERDYKELVETTSRVYPPSDTACLRALHELAVVQLHLRKFKDADATCDRAVKLVRDDTPGDVQRDALQAAAHAAQNTGQYDKAIAAYKRAQAASEKITVLQAEIIEADLGICLVEAQRYKEAEPVLLEALKRISTRWGPDCDIYRICLSKYIEMLRKTSQNAKADAIEAAGKV